MVKVGGGATMLGRYEKRTWQYDPQLNAPPRYRRACAYEVFIPSPIEELDVSISGTIAATVSAAEAAIQELNTGRDPALAPLARLLLRTESIASSKVEGMQVDIRALARAEVSSDKAQKATPTALEVLGNIDAMQLAIENATHDEFVRAEQLVEIHSALLERAPNAHIAGRIRSEQNWIGGNDYNPCGADFVPPPPEEVPALLGDLGRFSCDDRLSPLIQAAIAHAQFETIHPFADGNGRTGRALVQVILRRRGLAPSYVPPISVILATNKESYISGLTAYRQGRIEAWLEVFAVAAERAARLAGLYLTEVRNLQEVWRSMVRNSARIRSDAAAWKLIDVLPGQPIVTLPAAVAKVERTKPAVNQAIEQLVAANVLIPLHDGKRNRAWESFRLLDLLTRLESGEAPDGDPDTGHLPDVSERDSVVQSFDDEHIESSSRRKLTRLSSTDPIFRLGPGSWLIPPGEEPEFTARLAAALPSVLPLGGSGSSQLVTRLRGQRREEFLVGLLETSSLTAWLRSLGSTWHWSEDVNWTPAGSGSPEFTELWFAPFGFDNRRPALMSRCAFATGVVDDVNVTSAPSIQAAIDIMLNIWDVDVDRQRDGIRHATDQPPTPAAQSLSEVAGILGHLFEFVPVTAQAAKGLLPRPQPETARVGAWISTSGGPADRVIDLREFRRIPRSPGLGQAADAFRQELAQGSNIADDEVREFVSNLLYEALERGGYRDLDDAIAQLR
jgi:Fic family protein